MFRMYRTIIIFLWLRVITCELPDQVNDDRNDEFIPTKEWQTVKPGQKIPRGLHIRQSLKTGLTEAKLLHPEMEAEPSPAVLVATREEKSVNNSSEDSSIHRDTILRLSHTKKDEKVESTQPHRKFRSYQAIKTEFDALNFSMKTDIELLNELSVKLSKTVEKEHVLTILEDLAYLLHQIDNGRHFAQNDGFTLVHKFLLDDDVDLRKAALSLITAAIQGNSKVKVLALQNGVLDMLHQFLKHSTETNSRTLVSTYLTTLGSLLRDFPSAQTYFFNNPSAEKPGLFGSLLLSKLFDMLSTGSPTSVDTTLQVKIVSLLGDLISERVNARTQAQSSPDSNAIKLWQLYSKIGLEDILFEEGWCARIGRLLQDELTPAVEPADYDKPFNHDRRETILRSSLNLLPVCRQWVPTPKVDSILQGLEDEYLHRSEIRDDKYDYYFADLYTLVKQLRNLLSHRNAASVVHSEL